MNAARKQILIEGGFVAFLLVLCAILTALQYRWTGELSRAEATRLRLSLAEQAQALAEAFDTELARSCAALSPSRAELRELSCADSFAARHREWRAASPRPIFRRVAVAVPSGKTMELFAPDEQTGKAVLMDWPTDWSPLREFATRMLDGGRPGLDDRSGEFMEFPIFGGRPGGGPGGGERGWLLVQLDLDYLRSTWLPELVRSHLSLGETLPCDVTVTETAARRTLFATAADNRSVDDVVFTARIHRDGLSTTASGSGPRGGPGGELPGRRVSKDGGLWTLQIRQRPGVLEALVASSRRRNLGVALLVNGLILAAGVALVFHTRRSRQLAEQQMHFVATVSHELRTPLTVIRGAGHNLLRGVVKERAQIEEYSRLIIQHAEQLKELVEQTLTLAGANKARETMRREPVDLPALLKEAIAAVADDTQAAGCEVQVEVPSSLPLVVGDAAALRRVFQNLITNAARHGGDGKWIGISAASANDRTPPLIEVSVRDRGPGIPASEHAEIFKPFFRGAEAQARQTRGSGLGLSVVREIVETHGGSVSVDSGNEPGTTFTVRLPATV